MAVPEQWRKERTWRKESGLPIVTGGVDWPGAQVLRSSSASMQRTRKTLDFYFFTCSICGLLDPAQ